MKSDWENSNFCKCEFKKDIAVQKLHQIRYIPSRTAIACCRWLIIDGQECSLLSKSPAELLLLSHPDHISISLVLASIKRATWPIWELETKKSKRSRCLLRGSNTWPFPYEGNALPTELRRHLFYAAVDTGYKPNISPTSSRSWNLAPISIMRLGLLLHWQADMACGQYHQYWKETDASKISSSAKNITTSIQASTVTAVTLHYSCRMISATAIKTELYILCVQIKSINSNETK